MGLQILILSVPFAAVILHGAVHVEDADPIAKLPIEKRSEFLLLADGAGLVHALDSSDAGLAVVLPTAAGEVRIIHYGEADGAKAVIGWFLEEPDVKPSFGSWNSSHDYSIATTYMQLGRIRTSVS